MTNQNTQVRVADPLHLVSLSLNQRKLDWKWFPGILITTQLTTKDVVRSVVLLHIQRNGTKYIAPQTRTLTRVSQVSQCGYLSSYCKRQRL